MKRFFVILSAAPSVICLILLGVFRFQLKTLLLHKRHICRNKYHFDIKIDNLFVSRESYVIKFTV